MCRGLVMQYISVLELPLFRFCCKNLLSPQILLLSSNVGTGTLFFLTEKKTIIIC